MKIMTRHKILGASLLYRTVMLFRKAFQKGAEGIFTRKRIQWNLDLREGIDFAIYLQGVFEPKTYHFYKKNIQKNDTILDIGANIGAHTMHFGSIVSKGTGKVVAIEATEYAYNKLQQNLKLNSQIKNVIPIHCLLNSEANKNKETAIYSSWPLVGATEKHKLHQGVLKTIGKAQKATLDDVVKKQNIDRIDWIKLDVDGHELDVLMGAAETLKKNKPNIIMELSYDTELEHSEQIFCGLINYLSEHNYQFHTLKGKKLSSDPQNLKKIIPPGMSINVVLSVAAK